MEFNEKEIEVSEGVEVLDCDNTYQKICDKYLEAFYSIKNRHEVKVIIIPFEEYNVLRINSECFIVDFKLNDETLFGIPLFTDHRVPSGFFCYSMDDGVLKDCRNKVFGRVSLDLCIKHNFVNFIEIDWS